MLCLFSRRDFTIKYSLGGLSESAALSKLYLKQIAKLNQELEVFKQKCDNQLKELKEKDEIEVLSVSRLKEQLYPLLIMVLVSDFG
ncbi:hypothetical protein LSTR_LSTR006121 [Laodelphax striatellus]|uniref:Uncharacterized protein n=1 Tax=Laodelphax striatellus TaxID=195883 RepID=A0A482WZ39_LAOST|nr:hypothetical protein LSTR_LSTR006121 [Laodelphax striatellus]